MAKDRVAVIALGGNAISHPDDAGTIHDQFRHTRDTMKGILAMIQGGFRLAISHGNGPQVGNSLQRNELARGHVPELPLGVLVAGTQGWMGYMIEQSLINMMHDNNIEKDVVTVMTQVLVDKNDPSLKNPTKFVGQHYPESEAQRLSMEFGWQVKKYPGAGMWRRVVGSPIPKEIVNSKSIKHMLDQDWVVIAVGGGGVPCYRDHRGWLEGVDAVIDKDRASQVLANEIDATDLVILTAVEKVCLNFGRTDQVDLDKLSIDKAREYLEIGHFPPGSMGPKIEAAINFIERGGEKVIITDPEHVVEAIEGKAGTTITK